MSLLGSKTFGSFTERTYDCIIRSSEGFEIIESIGIAEWKARLAKIGLLYALLNFYIEFTTVHGQKKEDVIESLKMHLSEARLDVFKGIVADSMNYRDFFEGCYLIYSAIHEVTNMAGTDIDREKKNYMFTIGMWVGNDALLLLRVTN